MTTSRQADIQPRLLEAMPPRRAVVLARRAEEWTRLDVAGEHIEEREYDEQQRLRRERIVDRTSLHLESHRRYVELVRVLRSEGAAPERLSEAVSTRLDTELRQIVDEVGRVGVAVSLQRYADLIPREEWVPVFCMADEPSAAAHLRAELAVQGFSPAAPDELDRFGIVRAWCPPEAAVLGQMAAQPRVCALADPTSPVRRIDPKGVTTQMYDSRRLLGVASAMMADFGHDVTIAVLDTGLDAQHPAFGRVPPDDYRNFTNDPPDDEEGHGTHVASIAAGDETGLGGAYSGIAPRARLVVGKVLARAGIGDLERVLRGMAWAVFDCHADVLSLSIGDDRTPANGNSVWSRACDEAFRHGTIVCVAAGNPEPAFPETVLVPGDARYALTVGAVDKDLRLAPFSARGSTTPDSPLYDKPDCVAPGVGIVGALSSASEYPPLSAEDRAHTSMSGTSMAAPAVAGCVALIKSKALSVGWAISASDLRSVVLSTARTLTDETGEPYRSDSEIGRGLIDVAGAFAAIEARSGAGAVPAIPSRQSRSGGSLVAAAPAESRPQASRPVPAVGQDQRTSGPYEEGVCCACGRRFLTRVGTFSPAWVCGLCGAPICGPCWMGGSRACARHAVSSAGDETPRRVPPAAHAAVADPRQDPRQKGSQVMDNSSSAGSAPGPTIDPRLCDVFKSRFEHRVRRQAEIEDPVSHRAFAVSPNQPAQVFQRLFGDVVQFVLASGSLLWKRRLVLAAVCLGGDAFRPSAGGGVVPAEDVLRRIGEPSGLDFDGDTFYAVGVYSPVGWPEDWKVQPQQLGNAWFYLIDKEPGASTRWAVVGHGPLSNLFDPESDEERLRRLKNWLDERLVLPGDQEMVEIVVAETGVAMAVVETAVAASRGRWRILEHRNRRAVQRAIN